MRQERRTGAIAGGSVTGGLVEISEIENLVVVGDLHGDSRTLAAILRAIDHDSFLKNPLNKLVFLGDYVDRGSDSAGVLGTVCRLKRTSPGSVVLIRGNHEAPSEFPFSSHDLPYELGARFPRQAREIYGRVLALFGQMTLATVVGSSLLLVHGGLPTEPDAPENYRARISVAQENHIRDRVMEELLWNDPRTIGSDWERSPRGLGRHFGPAVTERWLAATKTRVVVRGHEPCRGYRIDHDGKVLTLFSSAEPYPGFAAAYIKVDKGELEKIKNAGDLARRTVLL
jgi:protein phosphatase